MVEASRRGDVSDTHLVVQSLLDSACAKERAGDHDAAYRHYVEAVRMLERETKQGRTNVTATTTVGAALVGGSLIGALAGIPGAILGGWAGHRLGNWLGDALGIGESHQELLLAALSGQKRTEPPL